MSHHPGEGTVHRESGLTDDNLSPIWADDDRPRIPRVAAEREALVGYLEFYRATLERKCRGLTPEQARTALHRWFGGWFLVHRSGVWGCVRGPNVWAESVVVQRVWACHAVEVAVGGLS